MCLAYPVCCDTGHVHQTQLMRRQFANPACVYLYPDGQAGRASETNCFGLKGFPEGLRRAGAHEGPRLRGAGAAGTDVVVEYGVDDVACVGR